MRVPHAAWNPGAQGAHERSASGCGTPSAAATSRRSPGGAPRPPGRRGAGRRGALQRRPALRRAAAGRRSRRRDDRRRRGGAAVDAAWWRERAQADALRLGDVSRSPPRSTSASSPPGRRRLGRAADGPMNRILASRHEFGQGIDRRRSASTSPGGRRRAEVRGPLRRPAAALRALRAREAAAGDGYGLTLLLHSLSANYNQYARQQEPVAARRARRRVAGDDARPAAGRTASTRASPRPTRSRSGPTSRATTGSTPTGPR